MTPVSTRVNVWLAPVGVRLLAGSFSQQDRRRGSRYRRSEDQLRGCLSNFLLRQAAAELLGSPPDDVQIVRICPTCHQVGDHGQPFAVTAGKIARSIHLSATHGGSWVVVASSRDPVGVDVEPLSRVLEPTLDSLFLSPAEREKLRRSPIESHAIQRLTTWVRKEAVLKATGYGLAVDPSSLTLCGDSIVAYPPQLSPWLNSGARLIDAPHIEDHVTALAVLTPTPVDIVVHNPSALETDVVTDFVAPGEVKEPDQEGGHSDGDDGQPPRRPAEEDGRGHCGDEDHGQDR